MVKYYKFPIEKYNSIIILPNNYEIENYKVSLEFQDPQNLIVKVGCQTLIINNELVNVLIDELKNDILNEEYIGLSNNKDHYKHIDHILDKVETSNNKEYYITTKNIRLLGKNWDKIPVKSQLFKKYFKYTLINEELICTFQDKKIKNIPELMKFLLTIKEFLAAPEEYLMKQ